MKILDSYLKILFESPDDIKATLNLIKKAILSKKKDDNDKINPYDNNFKFIDLNNQPNSIENVKKDYENKK